MLLDVGNGTEVILDLSLIHICLLAGQTGLGPGPFTVGTLAGQPADGVLKSSVVVDVAADFIWEPFSPIVSVDLQFCADFRIGYAVPVGIAEHEHRDLPVFFNGRDGENGSQIKSAATSPTTEDLSTPSAGWPASVRCV